MEIENNLLDACPYNTTHTFRIEQTVEHLLANNVTVMEINPMAHYKAYYEALYALADMVNQFGYETTFRKKDAVCDGGLSALENAFSALEYNGCRLTSNCKITRDALFKFMEDAEEKLDRVKSYS